MMTASQQQRETKHSTGMTNPNDAFSDAELRQAYWDAQAQFGYLDIGPDEFVRRCRESVTNLTLREAG